MSSAVLGNLTNVGGASPGGGGTSPVKKRRGSMSSVVGSKKDWVSLQRKTFARWVNMYVASRGFVVEDLSTDLADGLALHALLGEISNSTLPRILKKPRLRIQKMENVGVCLKWLTTGDHALKLVGIGAADLVDGVEKLVLGLVWTIILRFEIADADGKAGLLLWLKRSTAGYDGVDVKNFTSTWNDGKALMALINKYRPDLMAFDPSDESAENLERAFKCAEEELGIARLLDVEDVADVPRPDDKSMVAYLSQFFKLFAGAAKDDALIKCITKAINVSRRHDAWIADYNDPDTGAAALAEWIEEKAAAHDPTGDQNTTTEGVREALDDFATYLRDEKPPWAARRMALEGAYRALKRSCKNNGRPAFEANPTVEEAQEAWGILDDTDTAYELALRDKYVKFQKADFEAAKFDAAVRNVKTWLQEKQAVFEAGETGSCVADVEANLAAHDAYEARFRAYDDMLKSIGKLAASVAAVPEHERAADVAEAADAVAALASEVKAEGDAHKAKLEQALADERRFVELARKFDSELELIDFQLDNLDDTLSEPILNNSITAMRSAAVNMVPVNQSIMSNEVRCNELCAIADELAGRRADAPLRAQGLLERVQAMYDTAGERKAHIDGMLADEESKEELRVAFAENANAFSKKCEDTLADAGAVADATPEEQLEGVTRIMEAFSTTVPEDLAALEACNTACDAAGIVVNSHTPDTMNSLKGTADAVAKELKGMVEALEEQVAGDKATEISPEQLKEMREVFNYFDDNNNNSLDGKEVREACQGIGLDLTDDAIEAKMAELGCTGSCNFDQFCQFMLGELETGDSQADVVRAFHELVDGDVITDEQVDQHFKSPEIAAYLHENVEGGDFTGFTEQLFSRAFDG